MIGTDNEGGVAGDDCTEAEASAECSDMRGKLYLSLDIIIILGLCTRFLYYDASTLQGCPYFVCTKGGGKRATEQQ
jgi:hypothetical protein